MKDETVRAILAILVVGTFMILTAFISLFPLYSNKNIEFSSFSGYFSETSSVYTGIVGVIVGYYFGRNTTTKTRSPQKDE